MVGSRPPRSVYLKVPGKVRPGNSLQTAAQAINLQRLTAYRRYFGMRNHMLSYNAKLGLILFVLYTFFYGGFVYLNAFSADTMEKTPLEGVNLAILYGFALIVGAFVLALIYGMMCKPEDSPGSETKTNRKDS